MLASDVFVETSCEVAFQQLVVVDCLGDYSSHKLEVGQMFRVYVGQGVDGIRDAILRRGHEQRIVRVEDLARHDDIPLSQ